jgi:hypothetical protein
MRGGSGVEIGGRGTGGDEPSSYGHHGAPLPAFKRTTISKQTMREDYVVKTRKNIINNVY